MDNLLEEKCSEHELEFIAVKIGLNNKDQNKYLCPQCLIELIDPKELILIREAKRQIRNKKDQISKSIEEECKQKINLATNLKNSLQELKGPLEQLFTKINEEIDQFKNQTEKQKQERLAEEESRQSQLKHQENDILLIKSLLNQFSFCQISSLSKQKIIEIIPQSYDISKLQIETDDERIKKIKLTPSLKFRCESHDQEIIMVQIDNKNSLQRLSCVQCISENEGKYITLQQLQKSIEDYYQQSEKSLKYCKYIKEQQKNYIIKLCQEQIRQLEVNFKNFEKIIEKNLQFKDQNIHLLEQEQLTQILMPIYQNNNTDHYLIIIEKQLEQDKQLYAKFVQQLQEFTYFNIQQQFDYQLILTKLENLNEDEISNQQCVQNDLEIVYLQYQINSFLTESKEFSLNEKLKQLLSNRGYLKDVQESLIENVYSVQDRLQEQYQKSRAEQGISEFNTETKIEYLETLKAKLNSVSLCNQVKKEILVQIDNATASLVKEINQYKQNIAQLEQTNQKLQQETLSSIFSNSYQPQFNSSYKFSAFSLVSPKLVQASSGGFGLAVMQPPLPKDKITQFIIKINKFNDWAGVGVCHLQTAQSFNYNMSANYQSTNHNTYIACAGGYRISSFQGYTGNQFTFRENSFLCCSYNSITYKLTLIHLNDGKTYEMDITKNSLEMSPCVILYGSAQIEII